MNNKIRLSFIIFCAVIFLSAQAMAITIVYETSDQGGGVWQYSYTVSDYIFDTYYGFTIYFDYGSYANIEAVSHGSDWDVITWEPPEFEPGTGDVGGYDALSLADGASLSQSFVVEFEWLLDTGTPGPQYFEIYSPEFITVDSGTTSPIPEPATIFLLACGLSLLFIAKNGLHS